jgi:DNA-binding CsgD family transcriptional regulator
MAGAAQRRAARAEDRLDGFLSRLPSLGSPDELAEAVAEIGRPLNLDTIMAGALHTGPGPIRTRFYFGNWPAEWMARYTAEILAADPLLGEARRRFAPFTWSELQGEGGLAPEMVAAFETGRQAGWSDGFAVPIHGPAGYVALVSYAGRDLSLTELDRALLRAVAHAAHDRGRAILTASGEGQEAQLTARELQVMRWVAAGKSDWEIGRILGIADSTAHFHVERVKRKLEVGSRGDAVGVLILGGRL